MAWISSPEILKQHLEAAKGVRAIIQGHAKASPRPLSVTTHPEQGHGSDTLTNKALIIVPPCREIFNSDGPIFNDNGIEDEATM